MGTIWYNLTTSLFQISITLLSKVCHIEQEKLGIYSSSIHLSRTFEYGIICMKRISEGGFISLTGISNSLMQGAVISLRKEIVNLASISMSIITHLLKLQSHDLRKCN
jgi:hypothetical protein